jgi:hypothetical protein
VNAKKKGQSSSQRGVTAFNCSSKLHNVIYSSFATLNETGVHFIPDRHLVNDDFESAQPQPTLQNTPRSTLYQPPFFPRHIFTYVELHTLRISAISYIRHMQYQYPHASMTAQHNPDTQLCSNLDGPTTTTSSPLTSKDTPHGLVDMDWDDGNEGVQPASQTDAAEVHEDMDVIPANNSEESLDDDGIPLQPRAELRVWCTRLFKELL